MATTYPTELCETLAAAYSEALPNFQLDDKDADAAITADGVQGRGCLESARAAKERENEEAIGGLRNAARAVERVCGWQTVGITLDRCVASVLEANWETMSAVLDCLGRKQEVKKVPESLCKDLRDMLAVEFEISKAELAPGPGGIYAGIVKALTFAAADPDVQVHEWLRGHVPLGITAPILPGGVFPVVPTQGVGKEADRLMYYDARVWDETNYSSYEENREVADKEFRKDLDKGYVQWVKHRRVLEEQVGKLTLAKVGVIVKNDKVRLIHDMRRNGTNAKVEFSERLV